MGRVGRDPEMRTTKSGDPVCSFSLATSKGKDATTWHNIVAFKKTAEVAGKYLAKGSQVMIEGEITYGEYTAKDGTKKSKTDIIANRIEFVGSRPASAQQAEDVASDVDPDSIPF
jgi:single-strand DNA-binding protein